METDTIFGLFENSQIGYMVDAAKVLAGDTRLDSSHFIDDTGFQVKDDIKFTKLSEYIQNIEEPTLFTRIYCDKEFGVPYISSSEMSEIEPPVDNRYISRTLTKNIEQYIIKRGQILVSAAGTVGSIVVATEELDGVAGTSDILRINVDKSKYLGYIFTYLTSDFGANELANLAYGAIIKRVRGFQLADLRVPVIDEDAILQMNALITKALENRDEANRLIKKARKLVHDLNRLPKLQNNDKEDYEVDRKLDFRLTNLTEFTTEYRLDSHFYNSLSTEAFTNIMKYADDFSKLGDAPTERIFYLNRFSRTFVEEDFGIPYLAGKDMIKINPLDIAYLSLSETQNLQDYKLNKGWILMSCSGTLARTCFIYQNYEDWVATHDLIRIVPNPNFDEGYLYAFLSSEYGYYQALKFKHGAVIDHLTPEQISEIILPIPSIESQNLIGDLIRKAYTLRAESISLENKSQKILSEVLK